MYIYFTLFTREWKWHWKNILIQSDWIRLERKRIAQWKWKWKKSLNTTHDSRKINEIQKISSTMSKLSKILFHNMLMMNEKNKIMLKWFSAKEIARLEDKHLSTIMKNHKRYIPIRIDNNISRTKERWFSIKYLRVCDFDKYSSQYLISKEKTAWNQLPD